MRKTLSIMLITFALLPLAHATYYDAETNLFYNYFRDYDPQGGRYIQSDPIGLGGGVNTYSYVANNPISSIDPFGLVGWIFHGNTDVSNVGNSAIMFATVAAPPIVAAEAIGMRYFRLPQAVKMSISVARGIADDALPPPKFPDMAPICRPTANQSPPTLPNLPAPSRGIPWPLPGSSPTAPWF